MLLYDECQNKSSRSDKNKNIEFNVSNKKKAAEKPK